MNPDTPFIKVDDEVLQRNIANMAELANQKGVSLRPHSKTHKIPEIARAQLKAGAKGITVAKVSEAEVMAQHGMTDIFIAYPIVTKEKIKRILSLNPKINLIVGVDSLTGARKLSEMAGEEKQQIDVYLEVDTGLKRTGARRDTSVHLALEINKLTNIHVRGIYTYKGAVLDGKPTLNLEEAGREEGESLTTLVDEMKKEWLDIPEISAGSTPTAGSVSSVAGITEIRPGTYVFNDWMQVQSGTCKREDCAASMIVTIVSIPDDDLLVVDGGSKTFATDVQPRTEPLYLPGFGYVVGHPSARFDRLTEEHGMIRMDSDHDLEIGDRLEIIPNHICSTINLHDYIFLYKNEHYEKIAVFARGKLQ